MNIKQDNTVCMVTDWVSLKEFRLIVAKLLKPRQLERILFHRKDNGASVFVRKIGGRLFLSPSLFYEWVNKAKDE